MKDSVEVTKHCRVSYQQNDPKIESIFQLYMLKTTLITKVHSDEDQQSASNKITETLIGK